MRTSPTASQHNSGKKVTGGAHNQEQAGIGTLPTGRLGSKAASVMQLARMMAMMPFSKMGFLATL
jgi:hypothetical protein